MEDQITEQKTLARDMTQGKILKPLLLFTLPMLLGNLFQQLYTTVDSMVVGRYVGGRALAAVGISFPVILLLLALFFGVSMGANIMVSQYFGAKNEVQLKKTISTTITITLIFGVIIAIIGIVAAKPILQMLNTPDDVFEMAYLYIVIIFIGVPGSLLYNIISGILRGLGDSKWPLIFLIIVSIMNIILDLLFVIAFGWGIMGVALATILAQGCSAVFAFYKLQNGGPLVHMNRSDFRVDKDTFKQVLQLGLPAGLQDTAFWLGMMVIQSIVNTFGYSVIAAGNVVMRVDGFIVMPMFSISAAATTFIGQNIGANNMERVRKGTRTCIGLIIGISGTLSIMVMLFGPSLMRLFTDDPLVLEVGVTVLRILGPFYWVMGLSFLLGGILRGAGDVVIPAIMSLISMVLIRIPLTYLLAVRTGDYRGLYYSMVAGILVGTVVLCLRFASGKWMQKAITRPQVTTPDAVVQAEVILPEA